MFVYRVRSPDITAEKSYFGVERFTRIGAA